MKKVKSFLKSNVKVVFAFILGVIVFSVSGAILFQSDQVSYTKNSQSTVKGALDDLYTRVNTWINVNNMGTPQYYAFGIYKGWCNSTDTSCNAYANFPTTSTTPPSGKNVYAAKYADGGYGVCINRNGTPHCFRGRNWRAELKHIKKVFSGANDSCVGTGISNYVGCDASDFDCHVLSTGLVYCSDNGSGAYCFVLANGSVECH